VCLIHFYRRMFCRFCCAAFAVSDARAEKAGRTALACMLHCVRSKLLLAPLLRLFARAARRAGMLLQSLCCAAPASSGNMPLLVCCVSLALAYRAAALLGRCLPDAGGGAVSPACHRIRHQILAGLKDFTCAPVS